MKSQQKHLAWHETMELHELVAGQTNQLMALKMQIGHVQDPTLHGLYAEAIQGLEQNLNELLPFYPQAPETRKEKGEELSGFYSGNLLGIAKTAVRNYAYAITETATPVLRDTFQKQLLRAIQLHAKVFNYMLERGFYPAYNLQQLLANDQANAKKALSM